MSDLCQKINIVGIEKELISAGGDKDKNKCWIIPFKLSETPEEVWRQNFYGVQDKDSSEMKRKVRVNEDIMKVEISDKDDLQKVLDVIKEEVEKTNVLCQTAHQEKMRVRQDLENLRQQERDVTQKFKDDSDNLSFE